MEIMYFNANARSNYKGDYTIPNFILKTINCKLPHIAILTEAIPNFFKDDENYNIIKHNYIIENSSYKQSQKNSVIIAVKKDFEVQNICKVINGFDKDEKAPDYLNIQVKRNDRMYNIIGFRMITVEDYDERRKLFNKFIDNNELVIKDAVTLLIGDFNNAKYYGNLDKSFEEVEERYWKQDWDEKKKMYYGEKKKVAQYNYNLHIIKDLLKDKGLELVEKEDDYSFKDKNDNLIHEDHLFISKQMSKKVNISFYGSEEPLDHRYFVANIPDE